MRILLVCHMPWDGSLGGPRVQIEIARELERSGHEVARYALDDAYKAPARTRLGASFRPILFALRAFKHVRSVGRTFDVIEAHHTNLPWSKRRLKFDGLLVARSAGLVGMLADFERAAGARWPQARGTLAGRIARSLFASVRLRTGNRSLACADLVNVPNESEREWLADWGIDSQRVIVVPNGIDEARAAALHAAAPAERDDPVVAFIGNWSTRKGAQDLPTIASTVIRERPAARFLLLGTGVPAELVRAEFDERIRGRIEVVSRFGTGDLPELLSRARVGVLPSYFEGFGLAVLELIAAGIPTVAFDVPGPRDILRPLGSERYLVPEGDREAMASALERILALGPREYAAESSAAASRARDFTWSKLAAATVSEYERHLHDLRRDRSRRAG